MQSLSSFRAPVNNFSIGMELECFVEERHLSEIGEHKGFWYVTDDGSLYGSRWYSREFVSQPLTVQWLKKEIKNLAKAVGTWEVNYTCGIHLHVSRKWLTMKKAKEILVWYSSLTQEEQKDLFGRSSNLYCRSFPYFNKREWKNTRYSAVNIINENTIEFRMFASGQPEWACYCVDMVQWMVRNAYHLNVSAAYAAQAMFLTHHKSLLKGNYL